ncbi:MAG TPA: hypothetical protein VEC35_01080 [Noviherbaspirillum sp.]|nr:hypothetical protein [Noviherbaspirillum sp.]
MSGTGASKGGMNARWIAMRCKEPFFWRFLEEAFSEEVESEEAAVSVVYIYGGVRSRAEFDIDPAAADRFHIVFRRPFADYSDRLASQQNNRNREFV